MRDFQVLTAFRNSALITFFSVALLVVAGAMAGYVIQRRKDRKIKMVNNLFMVGLMPVSYTHLDVYKRQGERAGSL